MAINTSKYKKSAQNNHIKLFDHVQHKKGASISNPATLTMLECKRKSFDSSTTNEIKCNTLQTYP